MGGSMKKYFAVFAALAALFAAPLGAQETAAQNEELAAFLDSLDPRHGRIEIPAARASLDLGETYDFYDADDARSIIVDLWGNPPESAEGVLGLVMPAGASPADEGWGAVVSFEETGYVSDEDAAEIDYDELLSQMKDGTAENNAARLDAGYPAMTLIGWAQQPTYNEAKHSLVWAKNLHIGGDAANTLNYDVRSLGRYGVLSLNVVSTMDDLAGTRVAANTFASHASFEPGARYEDFNASTDAVAEYGVAGLIAAGAGAAAAKKLGIFAILLKFIKPILLGLAVFLGVFWKRLTGLFGSRDEEEYSHEELAPSDESRPNRDSNEHHEDGGFLGAPDDGESRTQPEAPSTAPVRPIM